jgi:glycogen synthase
MRILITADTVGGVWIYTRELVTGLVQRGHYVILASLGSMPRPDQLLWLKALPSNSVQYHATNFPLEWMQDSAAGIRESFHFIEDLIRKTKPDVFHSNQFCYGTLDYAIPKLIVAHSDVISWWKAVHSCEPPNSSWFQWYRGVVADGLANADVVVAPSQWMLATAKGQFGFSAPGQVIYNGRSSGLFDPSQKKESRAITVGRLWDEGKQVSLLLARPQAVPIEIVGPMQPPAGTQNPHNRNLHDTPGIEILETQSEADLRFLFSQASIYVATSRYEPFGLAPVEAALSGCALIANDIPVFRELWGDCAFYFRQNSADELGKALHELSQDSDLRHLYAVRAYERALSRFNSERMIDEYESVYYKLASKSAAA